MTELLTVIETTFGVDPKIMFAIVSGMSFTASVLDAIWDDENQPEIVTHLIKLFSVNVGKAANDPNKQKSE